MDGEDELEMVGRLSYSRCSPEIVLKSSNHSRIGHDSSVAAGTFVFTDVRPGFDPSECKRFIPIENNFITYFHNSHRH